MGQNVRIADRVASFPTTVFAEFSGLAQAAGAVNLGQGTPDFDGPQAVRDVAASATRDGVNQYALVAGAKVLRDAVAAHSRRFYGMRIDPETMVTITCGATEAIFDAVMALVNPGDEVVLFEPFYDSYGGSVTMAGGVPRYVPLRPPDASHARWWFDEAELAAAFGPRTRLLILNTPHNPTGKIFIEDELRVIAGLCRAHDVIVLADEVYEHYALDELPHVRIATLPGMFERTVTVSSGGKTFCYTGWKVGWAIAPPALRRAVLLAHQFVTFSTSSTSQVAIAHALGLPDDYYAELRRDFQARRDRLCRALSGAGLAPCVPDGTYFVLADIRGLGFEDDFAFCRHLIQEARVGAIPPSAFYSPAHAALGQGFARFAFCKSDATLEEAERRLRVWTEARRGSKFHVRERVATAG